MIKHLAVLHGCSHRQCLLKLGKVTTKHSVHNANNLSCHPAVSHNMFDACNTSSPKHLAVLHGSSQRPWLLKLGKVTTKHSVHNATSLSCQPAVLWETVSCLRSARAFRGEGGPERALSGPVQKASVAPWATNNQLRTGTDKGNPTV